MNDCSKGALELTNLAIVNDLVLNLEAVLTKKMSIFMAYGLHFYGCHSVGKLDGEKCN